MFSGRGQIPLWGRRPPPHSGPVFMGQRRRRYQGWKILPSRNEARTWSWLGINQASNWTLLRREGGGEFSFLFLISGIEGENEFIGSGKWALPTSRIQIAVAERRDGSTGSDWATVPPAAGK